MGVSSYNSQLTKQAIQIVNKEHKITSEERDRIYNDMKK